MSIFFKNSQEQKDYIKYKINKLYPEFKTGGYFFRKYLKDFANNNSVILDAGCGNSGILTEFKSIVKLIIGVDTNKKLLEENQIVNKKINANLENIPLDENSIEIVVSEFVLEHLQNPEDVFKEISRILKPGGVFIFLTPNILNPIMAFSKILPYSIHKLLRLKLFKKEEETHRTYYRANSYRKLLKLGKLAGFQDCEISKAGNPDYLGFCKPLVLIAIIFEKIIDNKFLNIFKMYFVGCFIKKTIENQAKKTNYLLEAPEIILPKDLEKIEKIWDANFFNENHGYNLKYKNGQISFTIEYCRNLPKEMSNEEKTKFSVNNKIINGEKTKFFTYQYGKIEKNKQKNSNIGFEPEYHVSKPRDFGENMKESQQMNIRELAEFIKCKKVIFYTGAGLSAKAGVYNMTQLEKYLGINQLKSIDDFICSVLNNPKKVQNLFKKFCRSAFEHKPTKAHRALAEIVKIKQTKILTENFDLLQERTGIKPYHTENSTLKKDIDPKWFGEIDAIICVGLSYDDRGLLTWYKTNNPSGKIISLDLKQPTYLGEDDFLVKGDLQKILPKIRKQTVNKIYNL